MLKLKQKGKLKSFVYYEIDVENVTSKKRRVIQMSKELTELTVQGNYHLISIDLNNFSEQIIEDLKVMGINEEKPTLILAECILLYLNPSKCNAILEWISRFNQSELLVFEQSNFLDSFGKTMVNNLKGKGIQIQNAHDYPTIESQLNRLVAKGFTIAECLNMEEAFRKFISIEDQSRIAKLELFDEIEEWLLVSSHYYFILAKNLRS